MDGGGGEEETRDGYAQYVEWKWIWIWIWIWIARMDEG